MTYLLLYCLFVAEDYTAETLICYTNVMFFYFSYLLYSFRKSPGESGDVAPTPAARPSLRDMHSPQTHAKSTVEEDIKRHPAHDTPPPPRKHKEKVTVQKRIGNKSKI